MSKKTLYEWGDFMPRIKLKTVKKKNNSKKINLINYNLLKKY